MRTTTYQRHQVGGQGFLGFLAGGSAHVLSSEVPFQEKQYVEILHDLELFLSDPLMASLSGEAYPLQPEGAGETTFFKSVTPFNVLWPRAVQELEKVRRMPVKGPYKGLSPIASTAGQLVWWAKLLGSPAWGMRYDAAAKAVRVADRAELRRIRDLRMANRRWVMTADPVGRFPPPRTSRRRQAIRRDMLGAAPAGFAYSYEELAADDPLASADPERHRLDFTSGVSEPPAPGSVWRRRGRPGLGATWVTASKARNVQRRYANEFTYTVNLAVLITTIHSLVLGTEIAQQLGPTLVRVLGMLHRERQRAFAFIATDAFPE